MSGQSSFSLVAIIGTGRNGSTLISRLLDGIPGWFMHPVEVNFLQAMNDIGRYGIVRRRVHNNTLSHPLGALDKSIGVRSLLRYYRPQFNEMNRQYMNNTRETFQPGPEPADVLAASSAYRPEDFVPAFLRATAAWSVPGEPLQGALFKTIETPYVAEYERRFPAMKFIHIIRDPVTTWESMKRTLLRRDSRSVSHLGGDSLISFLEYRWLPHARAILQRQEDPRHVVIRYEDILAQGDDAVVALCQSVGLPVPAEPAVQTVLGGRHFHKMQMNPSEKGVEAPETIVKDLAAKHGYTQVVSQRERDLILLRTWEQARALGYALDVERPDPHTVSCAWSQRDQWDKANLRGVFMHMRSVLAHARRRRYVKTHCRKDL